MHIRSRHKSFHFITFFLYSINVVQKYIFYDFISIFIGITYIFQILILLFDSNWL